MITKTMGSSNTLQKAALFWQKIVHHATRSKQNAKMGSLCLHCGLKRGHKFGNSVTVYRWTDCDEVLFRV